MASRPRILSISFSNYVADARVLRQLRVLSEYGDVTTIGHGPTPEGSSEHLALDEKLASLPQTVSGIVKLAFRRHRSVEFDAPAVREALRVLAGRQFDLIVANEARALPLAHRVSHGAPVWGDMHEWAPEERTHVLSWRLLVAPFMRYICAEYLPKTQAVTTVNGSIARLYDEQFGTRSQIVRNAIPLQDLYPTEVKADRIRLVHSGGAIRGRSLETLIAATLLLDERFTLDFYLVKARDGGKYLSELKRLAGDSPRIVFHDAVPPRELPTVLNEYDIGVYSIPPRTTNQKFMLPNKFFDFVQARLALVFGPSVETSALITQFGLGRITDDFSAGSLVRVLQELTGEAVQKFKANSHAAATALSSVGDEATQRQILAELLNVLPQTIQE